VTLATLVAGPLDQKFAGNSITEAAGSKVTLATLVAEAAGSKVTLATLVAGPLDRR